MELQLPYPPSVNRLWRHVGAKVLIASAGRKYRKDVEKAVIFQRGRQSPLFCKLRVTIEVYPPDNRRRDLDNLAKAPLDSLKHAGVYGDDSQIDHLVIIRRSKRGQPGINVTIEEITTP